MNVLKMKKYFQDKTIVITGGGSGMGRALAIEMACSHASIHILDIDGDRAGETVDLIVKKGGKAIFYPVDVTDYYQLSVMIESIYSMEGKIDILINNAGMSMTGEVRDLELGHWQRTIGLNLMGTVHGIHTVYPMMVRQGFGQIVVISSMAGLAPIPLIAPYATSKYALVGLSRSLRLEGKDLGVKVNLVCPGRLDTSLLDASEILNVDREKFLSKVPFSAVPLSKAVGIIVNGMINNRAMILFPAYVRWMWFADRYFPFLLKPFFRYSLRQFRSIRLD
jgi:NAD(P)-dependent dehydrogenase (short-subunit alcohol dehydrogenase family)